MPLIICTPYHMGDGIIPPQHPSLRQLTLVQMFNYDMYVSLLLLISLCFEHFKPREYLKMTGVVEKDKTHRSQCKMSSSEKIDL